MNDRLRSIIKVKLWHMKELSNRNKRQREQIFNKWKQSTWELRLEATEVRSALCEENAKLTCEQEKLAVDKSKLQNELSMKQEKESLHSELLQEKQRIVELNSQLQCAHKKKVSS